MSRAKNLLYNWHENKNYIPKVNTGDSVMETDGIRGETTEDHVIQNGKVSTSTAYRFGIACAILTLAESKTNVHIARDNRASGPSLMAAAVNGALELGIDVKIDGENGISTTPQCGTYARTDRSAGAAIVITGSHNPEHQNGLKLFDKNGKKISPKWEKITNRIVNAKDLRKEIVKIAGEVGINLSDIKMGKTIEQPDIDDDYVKDTVENVKEILSLKKDENLSETLTIFDAANGSGSKFAKRVAEQLSELNITLVNTGEGTINKKCGANYVFTKNELPKGVEMIKDPKTKNSLIKIEGYGAQPWNNMELWSIDGDNDRNIGCYFDGNGNLNLIDGNKIAAYIIRCVKKNIEELDLKLDIGYIMTVLANKSAEKYVEKELKLPVERTKVGDKYTRAGAERFDIGVYYEASGHGAVHFSDKAKGLIKNATTTTGAEERAKIILLAIMNMQNEACGDGIRNSLLVKALMELEGWNIEDIDGLYEDYPKILVYISIENKNALKTKNDLGLEVIEPLVVKEKISKIMEDLEGGYEHVTRPSGTEPIIRVQVQGTDSYKVEETAYKIAQVVYDDPEIKGKGKKPIDIWQEKLSKRSEP